MSTDENSKGSHTDDSGVILNASHLSQTSQGSTDFKTLGNPRKRSLAADDEESNDENDENASEPTSRKEKSLGKLCKRFLLAMDEEARTGNDVHLETVARKMCVEKRRIYDIVNVMEALEAMSKTNKSFYRWHGLSRLPLLMAELAKDSLQEDLPAKILQVEQAMCSFTELAPVNQHETVGSLVGENQTSSSKSLSHSDSFKSTGGRDRNGKNSLAQLCRRFLMVLLCNPKDKRRVSLDVASTVLIKDPESEGFDPPSRSRCRRLYDIANVLVAIGLIRKVHYLFGTKKIPLFVYCGPEPEENKEKAVASMAEFLSRNGLIEDDQAPASKLRRVSSDTVPKPFQPQTSFQRSLTLNQIPSFAVPTTTKLPNISEITKPKSIHNLEDKENACPENQPPKPECDLPKPVPRALHRAPLASLNPLNMAPFNWGLDPLTNYHRTFGLNSFASTSYSMSSILGNAKTPTKTTIPANTLSKATDSPKAFRPVVSHQPDSSLAAAMILTSLCNGRPKF